MLNLILFVSVRVFAYSTDIDECASGPCQNGGTCVDQVNGYQCHCAPGYTDLQCQTGKGKDKLKLNASVIRFLACLIVSHSAYLL